MKTDHYSESEVAMMKNQELRFSVTGSSVPDTTFEEDIVLLKEAGIPGYAICEQKLGEGEELERQVALFKESGLKATICIPANLSPLAPQPAYMFPGPSDLRERIDLMLRSIDRLALFDPDCICVTTGSNVGMHPEKAWDDAVMGIREVCQYAAKKNIRIALEGCRHRGTDFTWLTTLEGAMRFIREVNEPNLGYCFDVYHMWDNYNIEEITGYYAKEIYGVQISDWRDSDFIADRVMPGDGCIQNPELIKVLEENGFTGWYDCEIFSDDGRFGQVVPDSLFAIPPREFMTRAKAGFEKVWTAAQNLS